MKRLFFTLIPIVLPFLIILPSMQSCKKGAIDLCAGVTCQNGGTCLNGSCSCPTGYEGAACEKEKIPRTVIIKGIILKSYPAITNSGGPWDPTDGPDIFLVITQNGKEIFKSTPVLANHNRNNLPEGIPQTTSIRLTDVTSSIEIALWDFDTFDPNDLMDIQATKPYPVGKKFPDSQIYTCGTNSTNCLSVEMIFGYEF